MIRYALQKQTIEKFIQPRAKRLVLVIPYIKARESYDRNEKKIAAINHSSLDRADPLTPTLVQVKRVFGERPESITQAEGFRQRIIYRKIFKGYAGKFVSRLQLEVHLSTPMEPYCSDTRPLLHSNCPLMRYQLRERFGELVDTNRGKQSDTK